MYDARLALFGIRKLNWIELYRMLNKGQPCESQMDDHMQRAEVWIRLMSIFKWRSLYAVL
ncbi:hypothetical protein AF72_01370 [Xylella taiwanensis]|uniref:Uncharacterized protein n=1 Tax=Xylella taiwanensis TaxID=1444770 RepID=Z9JNB7_9GAMM|nr:hypothetical protein AB672_04995 [Xylella taiwanensis]EWS79247.1 hypothetical protein AF72_01370 [Xylella taiwanensis]